ncbi:MAG: tetratricopeptide repeat protein [Bacteroidota bacterium]
MQFDKIIHAPAYLINIIWLVVLYSFQLQAQSTNTTKLPEADSIKIYTLGNKAYSLRTTKPDSAFLLANQALALAEQYQNIPSQVSLWRIKGLVHYGQSNFEAALQDYNTALSLAKKGDFMVGRVLNTIGNTYFSTQDYPAAISIYEQSLEYAKVQKDTIPQIDALNNLGSAYSTSGQFEAAINYYEKSLELQRAANSTKIELTTMVNIGWSYVRKNDLARGLEYFENGKQLARERKDLKALANFHRFTARGYKTKGFFEKSLEAYQEELNLRTEIGDNKRVARILYSMAIIFQDNKDLVEASNYFEKALTEAKSNKDNSREAEILSAMGTNFTLKGHCDTALVYFRQAVNIFKDLNLTVSIANPLYKIGDCYGQLNQLDSATHYITQAYNIAKENNFNRLEAEILTSLGKVNQKLNQQDKAIQNFQLAIKNAESEGLLKELSIANFQLYQILAAQGKYRKALKHLETHTALKDSLFSTATTRQITRLQTTYEFEQEKQALLFQNEQEKRALDDKIQEQRTWQIITGVALGLSLLIMYFVIYFQRLRRSRERLKIALQDQKLKLEQQERERLEEMDAFKSRFFTNISHELRTPLTIIKGMAEQIHQKPDKWLTKGTQMIRQNAKNLLRLVNQILDLRKLENNKLQLNTIQGDIFGYLKFMVASHTSLAEEKDVNLKIDIPTTPIMMDFDRDKLMKIVSNLLSNAIKFTETKGTVTLSSKSIAQQLQIKVQDTGIGIPKDQLPYIFDRYYQIEQANNPNPQGSGIGLALLQELVKLMQGSIQVESEVNQGTTFTVLLPITRQAMLEKELTLAAPQPKVTREISEKPHPIAPENTSEELPKLLIIEDNKDMITFLVACLETHYQLDIAYDGAEGINKAIETIPDLIISDVMMPHKNGFEVCDTLKTDERTSHIPIILLTAKADFESRLSGLEKGADVYMGKPFEERELLIRLEKLLELRKKLQAHYSSFDTSTKKAAPPQTIEDAFISKIKKLIQDNLTHANFGVPQLCQQLTMSRSQVFRKVKALTGKSPTLFIRSIRLQTARRLLETTNLNVSEVAYDVGFSSPSYFSTAFTEEFGTPPSEINN